MDDFLVVSDESVNQYGFRVLSRGGDFTRFNKNPIMLYVHERSTYGKAKLPIGKWEQLTVTSEGKIIAKPVFNEKNAQGLECKESFEGGFLNAASIHLDPMEWSEDPALMLPGQTLPTVTKWQLLEISMADLPNNANCVRLSHRGKSIALSGEADHSELTKLFYPTNPDSSMKSIITILNSMKLGLSLSDEAKEGEVLAAIQKALSVKDDAITAKEARITQLSTELEALKLAKQQAEDQAKTDKAVALVDGALSLKKITAAQKDQFMKLASADYDSTKAVLDSMVGYQAVKGQLHQGGETTGGDEDKAKRYDELDKANKLAGLKSSNPDEFKELFKAKFGKDPK